ncbi:bifunctional [glutamine synthetase] adenylyltransferase/[glutamine synthetase]-adenylyl-L-tyrosine phosphorylase [Pseudohoeflea coraliihabitans]|uniref:Bifunctional glutamine synthetase adenylyltransferase/adenylyl-removing enzyme n=1 Tax=Pseudohoeflea coraliihabitans TaxID=2860393 RepID=A0ABS6WUE6_9HYPH|nr:bifunctional [glutamine synthetase] adenylyltransferase/[glutamine synthetase]-adenylyl-L-tyrosine phosphorylase [Pseudohoeflea sp. DP4N28-3]MBW3098684.1 bifunctional [glutamine synthetase] adenylyltransferase/[glutamine synthetase]-adenylyl-L-tyrosine phosphorylase [Pseudohoeflea sp. DP4N28-3]
MTAILGQIAAQPLKPFTVKAAKEALSDLGAMAREEPILKPFFDEPGPARDFVVAALSLSPWLAESVAADPLALHRALTLPLDALLAEAATAMRDAWRNGEGGLAGEALLMQRLRENKRGACIALALNDLARLTGARETTAGLTMLADAALAASFDYLLRDAHEAGKLQLPDPDMPSRGTGLFALAMGKHGAAELNFSSDIDIVVFFDPEAGVVDDGEDATETFARLVRRLVRIMQERTGHGYVFRTDLRLRPDPGSTPLAFPVDAAMHYYESRGQNWERAAYIKARPVAGDLAAGDAFLRDLAPFIFRKYLDYAAIADIHSIKRQIHAHRGFGEIAVKGHNVKLGRGGIREIEFFVQTQQLIAGGRTPQLRGRRTEEMLAELARVHWIDEEAAATMTSAYWYLRDVEHRIQMVRDEQSHTLPEGERELGRIALMMGEKSTAAFGRKLTGVLTSVETIYGALFEAEAQLSTATGGNLVFTGEDDDPATLATLSQMGFERPTVVAGIIRTWHYGRYRATQSTEARARLTELAPRLLEVFGSTRRADEAIMRFDGFLAGLPSGIQLFSLLSNNPALLNFMVTVMTAAPRLADLIGRRPHVFDGMLDPTLMSELPTRAYLAERIGNALAGARDYEETLDRLRIIALEQKFLIGVRLLTGAITGPRAGEAFTDLADLIIAAALDAVRAEMEEAHGKVPGGRVAVLGMGKLGSRELTAGSDVDIILLYDRHPDMQDSDGPKPLDPVRYYARFTQRLIAALSAPTAEGILYEVDLRLRPSGNKGPVATSLAAFRKYQASEAETWEHMALTRARPVAGDAELIAETCAAIDQVLSAPRSAKKLAADVADMRALIDSEKPPSSIWDVKLMKGGLIDIEFIAQFLALQAHAEGWKPNSGCTGTVAVLEALGSDRIGVERVETLVRAHQLWMGQTQMVRMCVAGGFNPAEAPAGLIDLVVRAADAPDLKALEADFKTTGRSVRKLFEKILREARGRK